MIQKPFLKFLPRRQKKLQKALPDAARGQQQSLKRFQQVLELC